MTAARQGRESSINLRALEQQVLERAATHGVSTRFTNSLGLAPEDDPQAAAGMKRSRMFCRTSTRRLSGRAASPLSAAERSRKAARAATRRAASDAAEEASDVQIDHPPSDAAARRPRRAVLVILSQTLAIVPENKQALILRFGEIERTVNRYKPNEEFGHSGAGLVLRVPFTDGIQYIDKRILGINMERQQAALDRPATAAGRCLRTLPHPQPGAHAAPRSGPRINCSSSLRRSSALPCATNWASGPSRDLLSPRQRCGDGQYPGRAQSRGAQIWR